MERNYRQQTDAEHRQRAIAVLEKAKKLEAKKKTTPLRLGDTNNTILLIASKLSTRQREKLRQKRLKQLCEKSQVIDFREDV